VRGTFSVCSFLWQNAAGAANGAKIYTLWPQQREKYEEKPKTGRLHVGKKRAPAGRRPMGRAVCLPGGWAL
jgi:hypothetical protein